MYSVLQCYCRSPRESWECPTLWPKGILPHWAWKDRTTKIPGSPLEDIQPITIHQYSVPTWSKGKKKFYKDPFPFGVFGCMHISVCTGVCMHTWKSSPGVCTGGNGHLCFGDRVPYRPRESPDTFSWPNKEPLESVHLQFPCVRATSSGLPCLTLYKCIFWASDLGLLWQTLYWWSYLPSLRNLDDIDHCGY